MDNFATESWRKINPIKHLSIKPRKSGHPSESAQVIRQYILAKDKTVFRYNPEHLDKSIIITKMNNVTVKTFSESQQITLPIPILIHANETDDINKLTPKELGIKNISNTKKYINVDLLINNKKIDAWIPLSDIQHNTPNPSDRAILGDKVQDFVKEKITELLLHKRIKHKEIATANIGTTETDIEIPLYNGEIIRIEVKSDKYNTNRVVFFDKTIVRGEKNDGKIILDKLFTGINDAKDFDDYINIVRSNCEYGQGYGYPGDIDNDICSKLTKTTKHLKTSKIFPKNTFNGRLGKKYFSIKDKEKLLSIIKTHWKQNGDNYFIIANDIENKIKIWSTGIKNIKRNIFDSLEIKPNNIKSAYVTTYGSVEGNKDQDKMRVAILAEII